MPDTKDSAKAFFFDLLSKKDSSEREKLISDLIASTRRTGYTPSLHAVVEFETQALMESRKYLEGCPIPEEGAWMTEDQIHESLGLGLSKDSIRAEIGNHEKAFPSKPANSKSEKIAYWVSHENVGFLNRKAKMPFRYTTQLREVNELKLEVDAHRKILESLESICSSPSPLPLATLTKAAPEPLQQEGVWMTGPELKKAGAGYNLQYLGKFLARNADVLKTRKRVAKGCPFEAYITPDNFQLLKLEVYPGAIKKSNQPLETLVQPQPPTIVAAPLQAPQKISPRESKKEYFEVNGTRVAIDPTQKYDSFSAGEILRKVHTLAFNDVAMGALLRINGDGETITGEKLARILHQVNGMMFLDTGSTRQKLTEKLKRPYSEIKDALDGPLKRYARALPGVIHGHFIIKSELDAFEADMQKHSTLVQAVPDLQRAMSNGGSNGNNPVNGRNQNNSGRYVYHLRETSQLPTGIQDKVLGWLQKFDEEGILMQPHTYRFLMTRGILRASSMQSMVETFPAFLEAMKGHEYANFRNLAEKYGYTFPELAGKYFDTWKEKGWVRDIAQAVNPSSREHFYAIARGKWPVIEKAIEPKAVKQ